VVILDQLEEFFLRLPLDISFALFHSDGVCNPCSATATSTPVR
jgi:hypothetical protein